MALGDTAYRIKQGNLGSALSVFLEDSTGRIPNFSGKTPRFFIWSDGATTYDIVDDRAGLVVSSNTGEVEMEWEEGDVDLAGIYHIEVDLVDDDGKRETFPADGSMTLIVTPRFRVP